MEGWLRRTLADPNIEQHLLHDEGEVVVEEVVKHWVVYLRPVGELLVALLLLGIGVFVPIIILWLPWGLALAVAAHAGWSALSSYMDRFVITNLRVFRVRGVFGRRMATMPLGRILDITVHQPMVGRILGYGHFVFESVARSQGLRDVRFVGRPEERDLAIQRVVQRAGLRGGQRLY
ncbi:MAG TPA: PH domain-containing protein [Acidimicrobiales bacterium]|nr:PH domain-containing protein [Acidimicrobiales bacterium]